MNQLRSPFARYALLLLAFAGVLLASGCVSSNDPSNASSRPWNTRQSWETGLPGGIFDRR